MSLDKIAHFLAGAGAAKEVYDRAGYGTPDIWDFLATATGAAVVAPLI